MDKRPYINCDVESCTFNRDAKHCMAEGISICSTCSEPGCSDETLCDTFKLREDN